MLFRLKNRYIAFLQERIDLQADQIKTQRDELAAWRRLFSERFDILEGRITSIDHWVGTIAASRPGVPLPWSRGRPVPRRLQPIWRPPPMRDLHLPRHVPLERHPPGFG